MPNDLIEIGFQVDNDDLKSGLTLASQNVAETCGAIDAQLASISAAASGAAQALQSFAERPQSAKAIEDSFAEQSAQIDILKTLYRISADDAIAEQMRIEDARYASLRRQLEAQAEEAADEDDVRQRLQDKADAEELKHDAKMRALQKEAVKESEASWNAIVAPISGAFQSSLDGMIRGQETFKQALANMGQSIVVQFANLAVKRATDWIVSELTMTDATEAGVAARGAAEAQGQGTSLALHFDTAIKKIGSAAAETYAGVFAWASPELGPFAAIPATAAAALVVAKEALIPSAAGGWDIPAGLNPVTQLHAREMVLPAQYADVIRGLGQAGAQLGGGKQGGGQQGGGDVHLHVHAVDSQSVARLFADNKGAIAKALRAAWRGFDPALS
jgi:hypothetical protein